ncbi:hypothetical protein MRB53_004299 [Persea americana]|uniref:Uncharacterized protein n=1 Tax=Persea americana TaxID=3435 RepID=A0ACC2M9U1_PERAE|nr:hypothetical protein MRB53_004299 [Persea americana]
MAQIFYIKWPRGLPKPIPGRFGESMSPMHRDIPVLSTCHVIIYSVGLPLQFSTHDMGWVRASFQPLSVEADIGFLKPSNDFVILDRRYH